MSLVATPMSEEQVQEEAQSIIQGLTGIGLPEKKFEAMVDNVAYVNVVRHHAWTTFLVADMSREDLDEQIHRIKIDVERVKSAVEYFSRTDPDEGLDEPPVPVWSTGSPEWRCATCGRANIYHDPKTGACPAPDDETPKVQ